ncbi:MAG TPA: hypothetical protein PKV96_02300 [Candidatus Saccharimonas sp.]|nr:hypothetical protein [Candidatus Saccharimonas sp.]
MSTKAQKSKPSVTKKIRIAKKPTAKPRPSQKVDYYPNRMTVAVSALAGTILVLLAIIAVLGSR